MATKGKTTTAQKLRFPEFVEVGGWSLTELRDLSTFVVERVGATVCVPYTVTSGVGLVSQVNKLGRTIAGSSLKNYIVLERGDFAYNKSATKAYPEGYIARYMGDERAAVPNSIFTCFRANDREVVPAYLDYLFASNLHGKWLRKFIAIGARAHGSLNVSDDDLMSLPVPLPEGTTSLAEQEKIADCLRSLDEVIAAQRQKVEAMKVYKLGLMQQLFPQEGQALPRLRFPEFHDAPAWVARNLGPMTSKVGSGITPLGGDKNYKSTGRPFVRSQNVGWGELLLSEIAYIDEDTHRSFDGTEIQENDVLLNITGASIGRSAISDSRIVGGNVNQHVCIIRTNADEINPLFLTQFLISDGGQKQIDSFQAGGNRQGLNFAQVRLIDIPLPPTELEQRRIADHLASLDVIVFSEESKLEIFKAHMKGLMQQLFPSPMEVEA